MLEEVIREMEYELDRSVLFVDPMNKDTLEINLRKWINALKDIDHEMCVEFMHKDEAQQLDDENVELRRDIKELERKIAQVKEIL